MLFCHGNGGNITHRVDALKMLHRRAGVSVLIFDYRGYGRSEGKPSEAGVLADARAARAWLAAREKIAEADVVLMGESLGGAVAVDLAARDGARALVLESTFSSLPDVAAYHYPWLPVRWVMRTRFDSAGKIGDYHGPLLAGPRRRRHDRAAAVRPAAVRGGQRAEAVHSCCPATTTTTRCRWSFTMPWRVLGGFAEVASGDLARRSPHLRQNGWKP